MKNRPETLGAVLFYRHYHLLTVVLKHMYYNSKTVLFLDGKFVKAKDAFIDPFSQTLHYGYGVFEGLRSYESVHGVKIFRVREHFERMKRSCELLGISLNYSVDELAQI